MPTEGEENEVKESGPKEHSIVQQMEDLLEKLKILDYEKEMSATKKKKTPPLSRTHFALASANANNQFKSFLEIVVFLMKQCQHEFLVDKYDDPNTSVNKLILSLKTMGFSMDFPSAKLKQGYGEAVCTALNFMCDKAIETKGFSWGRPDYPKEEYAEEAEVDKGAEMDDDDTIAVEEEEEEFYSDLIKQKVEDSALEESSKQILVATIDPIQWKTELERVGPKLKAKPMIESTKEWRSHIQQTRQHETTIVNVLPSTSSQLKQIGTELSEVLEKMGSKEKYINNQFDHMRQEYHEAKTRLEAVTERSTEFSEKVNSLTMEYSNISEQLNEIKSHMDDRGNKMTDTSPLVKIKAALQALRSEIKTFELRIGVVGHTLLQAKSSHKSLKHMNNEPHTEDDPEYDFSDDDMY